MLQNTYHHSGAAKQLQIYLTKQLSGFCICSALLENQNSWSTMTILPLIGSSSWYCYDTKIEKQPPKPEIYIMLTVQTNKCTIREAWSLLLRPTSHSKVYLNAGPVIYLLCTYGIQHLEMQQSLAKYLNIFSTSGDGVTHKPLMYHVEVKFKPRYTQHFQTFQPCPVSDWKEGKFPLVITRKGQFLFSVFD